MAEDCSASGQTVSVAVTWAVTVRVFFGATGSTSWGAWLFAVAVDAGAEEGFNSCMLPTDSLSGEDADSIVLGALVGRLTTAVSEVTAMGGVVTDLASLAASVGLGLTVSASDTAVA